MQNLVLFTSNDLKSCVNTRKGETKFGEHVQLINNLTNIYDNILELDVDYVIFGISEDIGVIANHGKSGTYKAWDATIKILLNTQSNAYINPKRILILGHLDYSKLLESLKDEKLSTKKRIALARKHTEDVDADVSYLVFSIIKAGKTPIVIGGGHNNAYGNIKGSSLALKHPINVVNFDAHHDFRPEEGRHSGNGFSYAYNEGFLKNYFKFLLSHLMTFFLAFAFFIPQMRSHRQSILVASVPLHITKAKTLKLKTFTLPLRTIACFLVPSLRIFLSSSRSF